MVQSGRLARHLEVSLGHPSNLILRSAGSHAYSRRKMHYQKAPALMELCQRPNLARQFVSLMMRLDRLGSNFLMFA
jgi:hypothetical protein